MTTRVSIKVHAGAKWTCFAGRVGDVWKLQIAAPPVDGKANDAIVKYLAKLCGVTKSRIRMSAGFANTTKLLEIEGISPETLDRVILEAHGSKTDTGSTPTPKS